jgi:hypothetical protein
MRDIPETFVTEKDTLTILMALNLVKQVIYTEKIITLIKPGDKKALSKKQIERVINLLTIKDRK